MNRLCAVCVFLLLTALPTCASAASKDFEYFREGNRADVTVSTEPGFLLLGGGADQDDAFRWMCAKVGGGDFLVLRATGGDAYNSYIRNLCPALNSVSTLVIRSRNSAEDPFAAETIDRAEAIFIAGGDQANYVNFWKGTPVQNAINKAIARGVPVGGTSAGLAILGEFSFAALNDTAYSYITLADPFDRTVTLDRAFLSIPLLEGVITDTHFVKRDRLGRLLTFMARIIQDGWAPRVRSVAVDETAGVGLELDGATILFGKGPAYFMEATAKPTACVQGKPLGFGPVAVFRLKGDARFNVRTWSGERGAAYELHVENGAIISTQTGGSPY